MIRTEVGEVSRTDIDAVRDAHDEGFDPDKRVDLNTHTDVSPSHLFDPDSRVGRNASRGDGLEQADVQPAEVGTNHDVTHDGRDMAEAKAEKVYTDDNGKVYRIGDDLVANNEYTINKYRYKTDGEGRIQSAEGFVLQIKQEKKDVIKDTMEAIGKGFQKALDVRGHLIADWFYGSNGLENIVAMGEKANFAFLKVEHRLAKAVKEGKEVYYKVEPEYSADSKRPDGFYITEVVDGEVTETYIRNEAKSGYTQGHHDTESV